MKNLGIGSISLNGAKNERPQREFLNPLGAFIFGRSGKSIA
jgi:hypothetical protein